MKFPHVGMIILILIEFCLQFSNAEVFYKLAENMTYGDAFDWCTMEINGSLLNESSYQAFQASNRSAKLRNQMIWLQKGNFSMLETWNSCDVNICLNEGICLKNSTSVKCSCKNGFHGLHCENKDCLHVQCMNNGSCVPNGSSHICQCPKGFTGQFCEFDDCTKQLCKNDGTCKLLKETVFCSCKNGYFGKYCEYSANTTYDYIGCYKDDFDRVFNMDRFRFERNLLTECVKRCSWLGARYFGLENDNLCFCGNSLPNKDRYPESNNCTVNCPKGHVGTCSLGGRWALAIYQLSNTTQESLDTNYTCTFDAGDPCFLTNYPVEKYAWIFTNETEKPQSANYAIFEGKGEIEKGSRAYMGAILSIHYPTCILLRYSITSKGAIHLKILTTDSSLTDTVVKIYNDTNGSWRTEKYQLNASYFQMVLLIGELGSTQSAVRIGDVKLLNGYCGRLSTFCVPGMICEKKKKDGGCSFPDQCQKYNQQDIDMKKLLCSYQYDIPCFMERTTMNWKRVGIDKARRIYVLNLESNRTEESTKGILQSFKLPPNRIMCFTFVCIKKGNISIEVDRVEIDSNIKHNLLNKNVPFKRDTPYVARIEFYSGLQSKIMMETISYSGNFSIKDIQLVHGWCSSKMEQETKYTNEKFTVFNSIFLKNKGISHYKVPDTLEEYNWTLAVPEGYSIMLNTTSFEGAFRCNVSYWQVIYGRDGRVQKFCGGKFLANDSVVILRLLKNKQESFDVYVRWETYYETCPAIYQDRADTLRVNYDCDFELGSAVCANNTELASISGEQMEESLSTAEEVSAESTTTDGDNMEQTISTDKDGSTDTTLIVSGLIGGLVLLTSFGIITFCITRGRRSSKKNALLNVKFENDQGNLKLNCDDETKRSNKSENGGNQTTADGALDIENGAQNNSEASKGKNVMNQSDNMKIIDKKDIDFYDAVTLKTGYHRSVETTPEENNYARVQNSSGHDGEQNIYDHTETSKMPDLKKDEIYSGLKENIYDHTKTSKLDSDFMDDNTCDGIKEGIYDHANAPEISVSQTHYAMGNTVL